MLVPSKNQQWYKRVHDQIIDRARFRTRSDGKIYELHHIVPKCMGGPLRIKSNLVLLTPEEHYIIHQLLVKLYPSNLGVLKAALAMTFSHNVKGRINNKLYGWLRKRLSESYSKTVYQYDFNGKLLNTFNSLKHAESVTGFKWKTISAACRKELSCIENFLFSYEEICPDIPSRPQNKVKVDQLTITEEFIKTFSSIRDASKELGIDPSSITKACKGIYKSAGKYKWRYNEYNI